MRRIALIFIFSLIFFSCEKDYLVPKKEVPEWFKTRISQDEKKIKDSPLGLTSYGAWIRYQWQSEYYFEYFNPLSTSSVIAISTMQDTFRVDAWDTTSYYYKEKCCRQIIWKGPKYSEPAVI